MTYYIIGRLYVERWPAEEGEEVGGHEVLDSTAISDAPWCDANEELTWSIFDDRDVPKEPGMYAVMYVASMHPYQDYWGEHDVNVDIEWTKITRLSERDAKEVLGEALGPQEETKFEDLLNEVGQGDVICLK